jgi:F-type H+-transporting ATPase subunit b
VELNLSTFLLEIVNFLILVWLLRRFLYQPVSVAIAERRQQIARSIEQARTLQVQAEQLRSQYEARLSDWEAEKRRSREILRQELEAERQRALREQEKALTAEREKARVLLERQRHALESELEREALRLSRRFATRLLERLAGPELETLLGRLLLEELSALPAERWQALNRALEDVSRIEVDSVFPLSAELRTRIEQTFAARTRLPLTLTFRQDPRLITGLRVRVGPLLLAANLAEELEFFDVFEPGCGHFVTASDHER